MKQGVGIAVLLCWALGVLVAQQIPGNIDSPGFGGEVVESDSLSAEEEVYTLSIGNADPVAPDEVAVRAVVVNPLWLFLILMGQLVLMAILRISFLREIGDLGKAYFNLNISQQVWRDQELSMPISGILLNLNFIVSLGIFCYLSIPFLGMDTIMPGGIVLLLFLAFILVLYLLKYILFWMTAFIFPFGEELRLYSFNFFLNQKLMGIILVPLNFLILYAPEPWGKFSFFAAVVITAVLLLIRSIKGFVIGKSYLYTHQFHFVLYICTLEIVPLAVVFKLLSSWL